MEGGASKAFTKHLPNWLLLLAVILIGMLAFEKINLPERRFRWDDPRYMGEHVDDSVHYAAVIIPGIFIPIIFFFVHEASFGPCGFSNGRKLNIGGALYYTYVWTYGLALAIISTVILTEIVKMTAGRLRPDFLERCFPPSDPAAVAFLKAAPASGRPYLTTADCLGDKKVITEGRKSFFSGHTSSAFTIAVYVALFFHSVLFEVVRKLNAGHLPHVWRSILSLTLVLGAFFIAASRLRDSRHHVEDVLVGAVVGAVMGAVSWRWQKVHEEHYVRALELSRSNAMSALHHDPPVSAALQLTAIPSTSSHAGNGLPAVRKSGGAEPLV
eukprot:tig00000140_g8475.t1